MSDKKLKKDFTEGPIFVRMIIFAIPIILTGLLQLCYNMADNIVVGKFSGDEFALAAVGATGSLNTLIVNLLMGIGAGAGVVVAHCYGAKNEKMISRAVHTSITFSAFAGIGFAFLFFFISKPALGWMGINPLFINKSILYMRILAFGIPASAVYNYAAAILRNVGDSKTPLLILSSSGILNVLLNLLFVIVFHMTVDGVALATIISQYASATAAIFVLIKRKNVSYNFSPRKMGIDKSILKRALRLGIPQGIQGAMFSIANVILVSSMNEFDGYIFTGYTITNQIDGILYHFCIGFAVASLTFTAQNYGAKKPQRIKKVLIYSLVQVTVVGIIVGQLVLLLNEPLAHLFMPEESINQDHIIATVEELTALLLSTYFLLGIMEVLSGSMRGLGYSIVQMILYVAGICATRLIWIATAFPLNKTPFFLMLCYPISWIVTIILLGTSRIIAGFKLKKQLNATLEPEESSAAKI